MGMKYLFQSTGKKKIVKMMCEESESNSTIIVQAPPIVVSVANLYQFVQHSKFIENDFQI